MEIQKIQTRHLRLAWFISTNAGGGLAVAQGFCRQAKIAGHDSTLLSCFTPAELDEDYDGITVASLHAQDPFRDVPARLSQWLMDNPQDILVLDGWEAANVAIPHIPSSTRIIYAVQHLAKRYFIPALQNEDYIDAIVAVSETAAGKFRSQLQNPEKLHVVHNGSSFGNSKDGILGAERTNDLLFCGGEQILKGAGDVLKFWPLLKRAGFQGQLHWFGEVNVEFRAAILAMPGSNQIQLHGFQPRKIIFEIAARSKVFLSLSHEDAFGMGTIEAMGMGCLPLSWDNATWTKEIFNQYPELFVPWQDHKAFAARILRTLEMHGQIFQNSTARARLEFNERSMWNRYAPLVDKLSVSSPIERPFQDTMPPQWRPKLKFFSWVPYKLRAKLQLYLGKYPQLYYLLTVARR